MSARKRCILVHFRAVFQVRILCRLHALDCIPYYEMLVARIYPVWVSPFTVIGFSVRLRS